MVLSMDAACACVEYHIVYVCMFEWMDGCIGDCIMQMCSVYVIE